MISTEHISLSHGERVLLNDVSFLIGPHDRIGLVGANGTGKSTLLKILAGSVLPDTGKVAKANYVTVGYLPQDGITASGHTLYNEVETAFEDVLTLQGELEEAHRMLANLRPGDPEYQDTLEVVGELQHKLEDLDVFRMKSKIERVLMGLGFAVADFQRQTEEFSGGWQMRIALAKLLLTEPSLLLLDEPTNHLDIDSLQWLEGYLHNYNGSVILVSHDRAFLDTLTSRTLAIHGGSVEEYSGNYSFYERERETRKALTINAYKNQQDRIKQTQEFIDRFRYKASKARQVQSRIKQLEKMDRIEVESEEEEIRFRFPQPLPPGRVVMELVGVSKSYGDKTVFRNLDYRIERGERIAIVGPNGAGKSTLVRILAGVEVFQAGERTPGYNVALSYFAQHQAEELDPRKTVLQVVDEVASGEIRKNLRGILGSFLFHGDDAFKGVAVLSGGEKSRLALAKMLLTPANFLIMDEPTNHLDMRSKAVLQEALKNYDGTYTIVSHDRHFLDSLVTKVLEVSYDGIRTYLGTVTDYVERKKRERDPEQRPEPARQDGVSAKERRRREAELRQQRAKRLGPLEQRIREVEKILEELEARKNVLETALADPEFYKHAAEAKDVFSEHKDVQSRIERLEVEWNTLAERLQKARSEFDETI